MYHGINGRKFGRHSSQRKALFVGLAKALIQHEQIKITLPKAKDLRPIVEKLVTSAKSNSLHSRRGLISYFGGNVPEVKKILEVIAERYSTRNGGYLRILKAGFRRGDNAPMAVIEFV